MSILTAQLGRNTSTIIVDMIRYIDENKNNFDLDNKTKSILFNKLKSILDHDHWYSLDERKQIFNKSCELYFLTKKQKKFYQIVYHIILMMIMKIMMMEQTLMKIEDGVIKIIFQIIILYNFFI